MSTAGAPAAPPSGIVAKDGAGPPALTLSGVGKCFGGEPVLEDVDLVVAAGEVVALVGDNGAGKTTLVRCVAGTLRPEAGTVLFAPEVGSAGAGVAVVWQDLALCDNLDVIANLFLGRESRRLAEEPMEATGRRLLAGLGIDLGDVRRPVGTLSGGERQLLAVARAMLTRPALLVLDEPTAALAVAAARRVAALVGELRAAGTAVLLVSHRPEEVTELADRVVVLRRGRVVATLAAPGAHPDEVAALMAGAEVESTARRKLGRLRSLAVQPQGPKRPVRCPSSSAPPPPPSAWTTWRCTASSRPRTGERRACAASPRSACPTRSPPPPTRWRRAPVGDSSAPPPKPPTSSWSTTSAMVG